MGKLLLSLLYGGAILAMVATAVLLIAGTIIAVKITIKEIKELSKDG